MDKEALLLRQRARKGALAALACYLLWGVCPLYWKLLDHVNPLEIISQRIIWCAVFAVIVCLIGRWDAIALLKDKRAMRFLIPAAVIVTLNWSIYIYAVSADHIVETSIGYYMNPLVSILLGMIIFKERLDPLLWTAVAFCCVGIIYFTVNYGSFPWISIVLAVSFGVYGAIKKKGGYPAVESIAVESTVMMPIAVIVSVVLALTGVSNAFLGDTTSLAGWTTTALLVGGGAVTAIPLMLFAAAANSISLTLLGFLQYLSPTMALLIGVFVNGEPFTVAHAVCFGCIWCGLVLVGIDAVRSSRKSRTN